MPEENHKNVLMYIFTYIYGVFSKRRNIYEYGYIARKRLMNLLSKVNTKLDEDNERPHLSLSQPNHPLMRKKHYLFLAIISPQYFENYKSKYIHYVL